MRRRSAAVVVGLLVPGLAALGAASGGGSPSVRHADGERGVRGAEPVDRPARQEADSAGALELMSALGCGACHGGVPEPVEARRVAPRFGPGGRARSPDSVLAVLLAPSPRHTTASAARMPDFHLSPAEALALTLFLETTLPEAAEGGRERVAELRDEHPSVDPELGRRLFLALDCAGCHRGTDVPSWKSAPDLSMEGRRARRGWLTTWLARPTAVRPYGFFPGTGTRMPDFGLSDAELRTLVDHLAPPGARAGGRVPTAEGGAGAPGPAYPAPPAAHPLSPFGVARAGRLLRRRSACLGCHALAGSGGRVAPDLAGVRLRRPDAYVWAMLRDPDGTRPRSIMPRSPDGPSRDTLFFRLLTTGEWPENPSAREPPDHAGYLDLVSHPVRPPEPWMLEEEREPATAAARYRDRCASCHGVDGGGDGFNARYLRVPPARHGDSAAMAARTDARLYNGIHGGGRVLGRSPHMPAFGRSLPRDAIWGLVGRIRELCGCRGPAWHRDNAESGGPGVAGGGTP